MEKSKKYYKEIIEPIELKYSKINKKMKKIKSYNSKRIFIYRKLKSKYKKLLDEKYDEYMDVFLYELASKDALTPEEEKHMNEVFDKIYKDLGIYEQICRIKNK